MRRLRLSVALTLAASLVLAGCGKDEESSTGSEDQQTEDGSSFSSTWPLTGLPVEDGDDSAQEHPVLVAKIDNSGHEQQAGLGSADLVVEELVEGGITRLAAFFYSELPKSAGPMRSMRFSDTGIVKPTGGDIVTSGAAPVTIKRIEGAGIKFFGEGSKGFSRDSSREAPYNLMADLSAVGEEDEQEAARPDDYLAWGSEDDFPGGQKAKTMDAKFSAGHTSSWKFSGDHYELQDSSQPEDDTFEPDTVIALMVKTSVAKYKDPAGNPVPETHFEGKGDAYVFHDGEVVRATWTKDGIGGTVKLSTKSGDLTVPAGHTWLELVPRDGGKVTYK